MRFAFLAFFALATAAQAADSAYRVDIASSTADGSLRVQPRVYGPPDKALRYEVDVHRAAGSGRASIGEAGTVRLFDGNRLVAEQSASRP